MILFFDGTYWPYELLALLVVVLLTGLVIRRHHK